MAHDHSHTADGHAHHGHSHDHAHDHHHGGDEKNANRIAIAALLTGGFMGVELAGGVIAGSLALIADAGHMLSDFGSLALAWLGFRMARRPADARRTFGLRRFPVLAAFVNGLALFLIAAWIVYEAVERLMTPHTVEPNMMLWVASGGLAVNIASFAVLHGADRENLNVRGALLHVAGDLLGSIAAMVAAVIIMTTGWVQADPLLSILVSLIILRSAWVLTAESAHILLEGAPVHMDLDEVTQDLADHVEGVSDIHHAHLWSLDGRQLMMTLHAKVTATDAGPQVVSRIKQRLKDKHGIGHATIEVEHGDCAGGDCA
ncbi:MAG TPA: cation diffusion facilitator family transporter [Hyphomonadaceae bacterium]|nr:cation diffusion facilitator family transporter [Hyphomonadaceae bacterium]